MTGAGDSPSARAGVPAALAPWQSALVALGLGALWLGSRAYQGVIHDARLYAAQALAWNDPARFADDLFFAFGNQDSFTVFSAFYAPLIAALGVPLAHAAALAIGHAAWLLGAWLVASAILPDPCRRAWGMAGAITMLALFGGTGTLTYGEPFVTPRLFAEATTLAALGLALRGGLLPGLTLMAGGVLLHPLIALPGFGLLVLWHLLGRRGGLVLVMALAALGLAILPLLPDAVAPRLDTEWRDIAAARSPFLFLAERDLADVLLLAAYVAFGVLVTLALAGAAARLAGAALLLGAFGLLLSLVGGDVAGIQLVVAAQPWRALWLTVFVVNLLLLPAALALRRDDGGALSGALPPLVAALVFNVASRLTAGLILGLVPLIWLALLHVALHRAHIRPGPGGQVALRALSWIGMAVAALIAVLAVQWFAQLSAEQVPPLARQGALYLGGFGLIAIATLAPPATRVRRVFAVAAGVAVFSVAAATFDQRPAWDRFLARPGPEQAELARFIPEGSRAYWDGGIELMWFRLGRASYFSCVQAAGVVFHRGTAIAFQERSAALALHRLEGRCFRALQAREGPATIQQLVAACQALPALDHIVLADRIERAVAASWLIPVPREIPGTDREVQPAGPVYRYDCAVLRDRSTVTGG